VGYCPHPLCCKELDTTEQLTHTKIYIKKYMYVYIYLKRSKNGWGKVSRKIRALSQSGGGGGHSVMPNSMRPIDCRPSGCSLLSHSLYDPKDCSPPGSSIHRESPGNNNEWVAMPSSRNLPNSGFPVLHSLLEFAQTHVHRVGDVIQPTHPLSFPSLPTFNLQESGFFFPVSRFFSSDIR